MNVLMRLPEDVWTLNGIESLMLKCDCWQPRWTLITLSEMGQMEILPQTVESNLSLHPFTREGHQTPSPSSATLYCTAINTQLTCTHTFSCSFWQRRSHIWPPCIYIHPVWTSSPGQATHKLTLRSGMENLQQEARLVLAMVRLSFSTLVKLVLSRGTEINHKSVMTPQCFTWRPPVRKKKKNRPQQEQARHQTDCDPEETNTQQDELEST